MVLFKSAYFYYMQLMCHNFSNSTHIGTMTHPELQEAYAKERHLDIANKVRVYIYLAIEQ